MKDKFIKIKPSCILTHINLPNFFKGSLLKYQKGLIHLAKSIYICTSYHENTVIQYMYV